MDGGCGVGGEGRDGARAHAGHGASPHVYLLEEQGQLTHALMDLHHVLQQLGRRRRQGLAQFGRSFGYSPPTSHPLEELRRVARVLIVKELDGDVGRGREAEPLEAVRVQLLREGAELVVLEVAR